MKIYIHEGRGHYIGSAVVVIAENLSIAEELIREQLNNMGLDFEPLSISEEELVANKIVYSDSGDY